MVAEFAKRAAAAVLLIVLTTLTACGSPETVRVATTPVAAAASAQPAPTSPDAVAPEKAELDRVATVRAEAEATARKNAAAAATVAAPPAPAPAAPVPAPAAPAAAAAPATNFTGWVNSTLARYGVSPGLAASFVVGDTGFCGGYMCTSVYRNGTSVTRSVTTVSPGAVGNNFALIHEVAHQHGVGLLDTGGECAADVWARQYIQGSVYC